MLRIILRKTPREEWRWVVGYKGYYQVSSLGRVRSVDRTIPHNAKGDLRILAGKLLTINRPKGRPYGAVALSKNGVVKDYLVHRLVARAFIGPCPKGQEVRHRDGKSANCKAINLLYGTRKQNMDDCRRHGRLAEGVKQGAAKLNDHKVRAIRRQYASGGYTLDELGAQYAVCGGAIWKIVRRKTWQHC